MQALGQALNRLYRQVASVPAAAVAATSDVVEFLNKEIQKLDNEIQELELAAEAINYKRALGTEYIRRLRERDLLKLKQQIAEAKRLAEFADDPDRKKLAKELASLQAKAKVAATKEEIANFGTGAALRNDQREAQAHLDSLKRAEEAQFRLNNLHLDYFKIAQEGLVNLIMGAGTLSDKAQAFLQQLYKVTVERVVEAGSTKLLSLFLSTSSDAPGAGKVVAGAGKVVASGGGGVNMYVDARGGDEQSVQRALNRALPEIVAAGEQLRLGMYNDDPVARRRARRGQRR